ncbi:MAG TPA: hypothetical protein VGN04_06065 [Herbaspirillum sp.]|jgi:hypothetical protein
MPAVTNPWTNPTIFTGKSSEFWNSRPAAAPAAAVHRNTGFRLQRIESGKTAGSFFARFRQRIQGFFSSGSHLRSMPVVAGRSRAASLNDASQLRSGPSRAMPESPKKWPSAVNRLQALFQELASPQKKISKEEAQAGWEKFETLCIDKYIAEFKSLAARPHNSSRRDMAAMARMHANRSAAASLLDFYFPGSKISDSGKPMGGEEFAAAKELRNAVEEKLVLLKDAYRPIFDGLTKFSDTTTLPGANTPLALDSSSKPQIDDRHGLPLFLGPLLQLDEPEYGDSLKSCNLSASFGGASKSGSTSSTSGCDEVDNFYDSSELGSSDNSSGFGSSDTSTDAVALSATASINQSQDDGLFDADGFTWLNHPSPSSQRDGTKATTAADASSATGPDPKARMDDASHGAEAFTWLDHSSGSGEYFWWDGVSDSSRLESQQKGRDDSSETELKTGNRLGSSGSWTSGGIRG